MEGESQARSSRRVIAAAAAVASIALFIFLLVWYWPTFFNRMGIGGQARQEFSVEEKMAILAAMREADPQAAAEAEAMPQSEKLDIIEQVEASSASADEPSTEEKLRILQEVEASSNTP